MLYRGTSVSTFTGRTKPEKMIEPNVQNQRKRTRGACDNAVRKGGDSLTLKPLRQVSKQDSRDACIATAILTQMSIQSKTAMIGAEVTTITGT
jgi:hypothetical protein